MTKCEKEYQRGFEEGMKAFLLLMDAYLSMSDEMQQVLLRIVRGSK